MGVTPAELKKRLLERHGDSDHGFTSADANHDGKLTQTEMMDQMKAVGVPRAQMRELLSKAFKSGKTATITEDQYKNFLGISQLEWARRVRKKIGDADQAFKDAAGGKAELDEAAFTKQCESLGINAENAKNLFKNADADGNGSVSQDEYQEALGYTLKEWKSRELLKLGDSDQAFKNGDNDPADGKISEGEFIKQLGKVGIDAKNAKALYKKVDENGDGQVSETEYKNVLGFTKDEWKQRALKELTSPGKNFVRSCRLILAVAGTWQSRLGIRKVHLPQAEQASQSRNLRSS
jgi:Ca2+-binding EF-hand superfamily protein